MSTVQSSSPEVRVEIDGAVGRITLDAPDRLNALDGGMLAAVADTVEAFSARDDVRVIVLTGEGRGFCSGANLSLPQDGSAIDDSTLYAGGRAVRAIVNAPQPVVAAVNGVAAGMGVSLALAADYAVVTESASFVLAFSKIALMPDGGATQLVAASIGRARALRLALTGERLSAPDAAAAGLIAEVVDDAAFAARSEEVVAHLAGLSPRATALTKDAINAVTLDLDAVLEREETGQVELLAAPDFAEGVAAFTERRPARFGR